jgi:myo-inositol-1(or 4)-monophosphatase
MKAFERRDTLTFTAKGLHDYVSDVDRLAEKEIITAIRRAFPGHAIVGEETGKHPGDDHVWFIDPLDGTTNFMRGVPHFCVSIALQYKGRLEHGLIYDPVRDEVFTASRGRGAQANDRRIRVSPHTTIHGALLSTGFPYRSAGKLNPYMGILETLLPEVLGMRRAGSAALDLAYVAAGRYDGYWEFDLGPWDIAAGALMVKEAGGLVGDPRGEETYLTSGNVVAGNPKIFKALLQAIHPLVQQTP